MMMRAINHEARKREVFAAIIEDYIKTASAVSSEDICKYFDCSSATIRNIMYELEEEGYLAQIHTSSGRVPTDKGYRRHVDMLLSQMRLLEEEKERITKEYNQQMNKLEDILEQASEVLSAYTHCAGIVSFLNEDSKIYYKGMSFITEYPEFRDIEKLRIILKLLEEKTKLLDILNRDLEKKFSIYIGGESECREMANCSLIVSTYDLENKPFGRVAVLGPRNMNYCRVIPALEYVSQLVSKTLENFRDED